MWRVRHWAKADSVIREMQLPPIQTSPVDENPDGIEAEEGKERPAPMEALAVPISDLVAVLPHVHFIQAKFFEIDDNLHDLHVPWGEIIPTLLDRGWSGWRSSEYEGRREPYRGRDQVRRQHALVRELVAEHLENRAVDVATAR